MEEPRQPILTFKKLSPTAVAPVPWPSDKLTDKVRLSAYDVASVEDALVQPHEMVNLTTGLALTLPEGSRLITAPRSGVRLPHGVSALPREIEGDELRDVTILFWNNSPHPFQGAFSYCLILLFAILFFFFSLVKAGVPICGLLLDLGGPYVCNCAAEPVRVVELKS